MEHNIFVTHENIKLRPILEADLEFLRNWRNNAENSKYLRKIDHITSEMQLKWFENDKLDSRCYTFAIEEIKELNRIVGSVAIYNIESNRAEFGRMMVGDKDARGKGIGYLATCAALHIGFNMLGLEEIYAIVHEDNLPAFKSYQRAGFVQIGKRPFEYGAGYDLEIEITKQSFCKGDAPHAKYLS